MEVTPICRACRDAGHVRLADTAVRIGLLTIFLCWEHFDELARTMKEASEEKTTEGEDGNGETRMR